MELIGIIIICLLAGMISGILILSRYYKSLMKDVFVVLKEYSRIIQEIAENYDALVKSNNSESNDGK